MTDPLATARALHPDLVWGLVPECFTLIVGANDSVGIRIGHVDADEESEYGITVYIDDRPRYTERGRGSIDCALEAAVDLRRAIGWPVGVANG